MCDRGTTQQVYIAQTFEFRLHDNAKLMTREKGPYAIRPKVDKRPLQVSVINA